MQHKPRKRFSQNFLQDKHFISQIVTVLDLKRDDNVVEIGPGLGAITGEILEQVNSLTAVEIDRDLISKLQLKFANFLEFKLINADALRFDFRQLAQDKSSLRLIGNLPYNISTQLLFHLFEFNNIISDMHFMLQDEVVNRLIALPGSKEYGRLSVMAQYHCHTQKLFQIPASAFYPKPQVTSAIVRLIPYKTLPIIARDYNLFAAIVSDAFNKRRKILSNSLKKFVTADMWNKLAIHPERRPETLNVAEFVAISNLVCS